MARRWKPSVVRFPAELQHDRAHLVPVHPGVIPEGFGFLAAEEGFFQLAGGFFHTDDQFGEPGQEPEDAVVFDPDGGEGVIGRRRFSGEICGGGEDLTAGHFRHGGAFDVYHLAVVSPHHPWCAECSSR